MVTFVTMNKKEKLIKRFRTLPKDFTFEEVVTLFQIYVFSLIMHKPHPSNNIKGYMMRDILNYLLNNNYIK